MRALTSNCTVMTLSADEQHFLVCHRDYFHPWLQTKRGSHIYRACNVNPMFQSEVVSCDILPICEVVLLTNHCSHRLQIFTFILCFVRIHTVETWITCCKCTIVGWVSAGFAVTNTPLNFCSFCEGLILPQNTRCLRLCLTCKMNINIYVNE